MIPLSKTVAASIVILCGTLTASAWIQEPDGPEPRPSKGMRQEQPARVAPRSSSDEESVKPRPPAEGHSTGRSPDGFVGPPGLSEEAKRSFSEIPPSTSEPDEETSFSEEVATPRTSAASPNARQRPESVVEPPDLLLVEVLEALPGRPISGERLVRPDGRISLGFYGDVFVAGLTLPQIKERIVLHLRKFLTDDVLGLLEDDEVGYPKRDARGRLVVKNPRDTDRVFVDVTGYNSQNCYVMGDVQIPGRLSYTGGDTVLDLLYYAGGLLPSADKARIRLVRSFPKGSPPQVLPIDYQEIAMGTDSSTNYAILPNDRLVVPGSLSSGAGPDAIRGASNREVPARDPRATRASASQAAPSLYFHRRTPTSLEGPNADLERRIDELEQKLDRLIEAVEKNQPRPGGGPEEEPAAELGDRRPPRGQPEPDDVLELPSPTRRMADLDRPSVPRKPGPRRVEPAEPRPTEDRRPRGDEPGGSRPESRTSGLELPDLPASRSDLLPPDR